ncbi:hypothetical protein ACQKLP_11885 [Chitinophaga sp. NPDC101104]|uniref:hypothetical protein n=1 Tax=Chitinophaga sp. NPDC101104 TaxID=3390561 RepID=UPI003D086D64
MKNVIITGITGLALTSALLAWKYQVPPVTRQAPVAMATPLPAQAPASPKDNTGTRIQVALLLDTSNSMDGLIDQAKSRLWNIINTLTTLKYQGKTPIIEIALYEYGNDGLSEANGHIREVLPLTTDLDLLSEKLFSLKTNGGQEYCGAVINTAVKSLEWGSDEADMKLIYIAGNEPFDQGRVSYVNAAGDALRKSIFVNTIFCGDRQEGINTRWKDGADKGKGKYFFIDSDEKVTYIETPYDAQIDACNEKLNDTYIAYGSVGRAKKSNQAQQDYNAKSISAANSAERAVSKAKEVYKNESWDLVERSKKDHAVLSKISKGDLPQELQGKSEAEIRQVIAAKGQARDSIQKTIAVLGKKRQEFIEAKRKTANVKDDLGTAINQSILQLAATKGYSVDK